MPYEVNIPAGRTSPTTSRPPGSVVAPQADSREQQSIALYLQGRKAFMESRWGDAIGFLKQADQLMPNDKDILSTMAEAQIALRFRELEKEADSRASKDKARLTRELDRLSECLDTLRREASQNLLDGGQFREAVELPSHADFVFDSSIVDLREARRGVVNFDVLKPPASRSGRVDFSPPPERPLSPAIQKAHLLLDNPALEAVIFYERMGEAIGYKPSPEESQYRLADPVIKAVSECLNINFGQASPQERASVQQKTREIWRIFDDRNAKLTLQNAEIAQRSAQSYKATLERLKTEGILKPGENIKARERNDATFRSLMKAEVQVIILDAESGRREADRYSFDKLLVDISSIIEGKPRR